jgi:uncharacterized protein (UPF0179 family)
MANVTLVGKNMAVVGAEFIYNGPSNECRECKVRTVCFNLTTGRRYTIKAIREMTHPCSVHEDQVVAVEFEQMPFEISIDPKQVIEGAVVTVTGRDCQNTPCPNFRLCAQDTVANNSKVMIKKVGTEMACPIGRKLVVIEVDEAK